MKTQAKRGHLSKDEWNFDENRVPDEQLVACCHWEFARESTCIRDAVETAKTAFANQGIAKPESEEREAFRVAADKAFSLLTLTGFNISFWVGLPFPAAWQSVDKTERDKWAHVWPKIPTPEKIPPFRVTGDLLIASMLHGEATKAHETRQALYWRLSQIDSGVANLNEAAELRKQLSEQGGNPTPVALRGMGGVDSVIAQINWRDFTDNEIVKSFKQWVKAKDTRPTNPKTEELVGRRNDRGRDLDEWRASLERLGLLRLRSRYTFEDALPFLLKLGRKQKHVDPAECNREAKAAVADFHKLFPFLDPTENPRCGPTVD